MSKSWSGGSTYAWRVTRKRVLDSNAYENAGRCQLNVGTMCPRHGRPCRGVCTGRANEVHHTRGKRYGDDRRHLMAVCHECNAHVGDPSAFNPQPRPHSRW